MLTLNVGCDEEKIKGCWHTGSFNFYFGYVSLTKHSLLSNCLERCTRNILARAFIADALAFVFKQMLRVVNNVAWWLRVVLADVCRKSVLSIALFLNTAHIDQHSHHWYRPHVRWLLHDFFPACTGALLPLCCFIIKCGFYRRCLRVCYYLCGDSLLHCSW